MHIKITIHNRISHEHILTNLNSMI